VGSYEETGMIVIRALDGTALDVDENAVTLVAGRSEERRVWKE
jgi:hypothetical protein